MHPQPDFSVVVQHRELQAQAVAVLTLADPDGAPLPPFQAGAHIDVHLPGGLVRQYSLCGDPCGSATYRIAVLKDPASRGGSTTVHESLRCGAKLGISAPRNHFPLDAGASYSVLVGGGIGITPMITMAWELHRTDRPFELHYSASSRAKAALLDELAAVPWAGRVTLHFGDEGSKLDPKAVLNDAPPGSHLYVCGPSGFMEWVMDEARGMALASSQIHREYFAAPTTAASTAPATGFEVVAKASGKTVKVAADQTIVAALRTVGIDVPVSCEEGVCGTCLCTVVDGEPDHRDAYLTDEERAANDQVLVCCSRSRSPRLVLDV
jgi:ferredoxin-NADP reductase